MAGNSTDGKQTRRLMAIAGILDGMSRAQAAVIGLMARQSLRDWVHRFNAEGPKGLINRRSPGPSPKLTGEQRARFKDIVSAAPELAKHGVVRWRCADLVVIIKAEFGVEYNESTIGKLLHSLGFSHVSARPQHPKQDPEVIEAFKKNFSETLTARLETLPSDTEVELWFQDEARIGQKNGQAYQWAAKGTRPRQPAAQRYENACIFGAVCPEHDKGAALVMPYANAEALQKHLDEISREVAENAHAALLLAGTKPRPWKSPKT